MKTYQFKTNINCGGCIAQVTPHLNANEEICEWKVDTSNPDKIIKVETANLKEAEVIELVQKAGFKAQKL